jgi:hypothetical protein
VAYRPRSYFPDLASLATYLPPPVSLVPAFFFGKTASPAPAARQDICCASGFNCLRIKTAQDQGCPCGGPRNIVQPTSCSDPAGSCRTIKYGTKKCIADGVSVSCEESFIDAPCGAPTPTPSPSPTPVPCGQPPPNYCCNEFINDTLPGTPYCEWKCNSCPPGTALPGGCVTQYPDGSCPPATCSR